MKNKKKKPRCSFYIYTLYIWIPWSPSPVDAGLTTNRTTEIKTITAVQPMSFDNIVRNIIYIYIVVDRTIHLYVINCVARIILYTVDFSHKPTRDVGIYNICLKVEQIPSASVRSHSKICLVLWKWNRAL